MSRSTPSNAPPDAPGTGRRAVAIGGGHGLARSLAALRAIVDEVTAVVTVADDGGSSGRLRRDLGVPPPGDLRMALIALAEEGDLRDVLAYRFARGELAGHSLGNLILVALHEMSGGELLTALDRLGRLLGVRGRVVPCTPEAVSLHAATRHGEIRGQASVAATPRLERVWLAPQEPRGTPAAVEAIRSADLVVLGPGSLYTSVIPNLLVPDVARALAGGRGRVVYVANLREQPGETEGMSLADHLDALTCHAPGLRIDVVVAHRGPPPHGSGGALSADDPSLDGRVGRVITADLLDGADGHAPGALARQFAAVLGD